MALHFSINWDHAGKATVDLSNKLSCPDKSTLYSSLILGTTWKSTVIFGGTALGDVFIWSEIDDKIRILHRLAGHNVNFYQILA